MGARENEMADFETDYEFMIANEDRTQAHAIVPDAPPGAYAISGINSAAYPAQFKAIAAIHDPVSLVREIAVLQREGSAPALDFGIGQDDMADRFAVVYGGHVEVAPD